MEITKEMYLQVAANLIHESATMKQINHVLSAIMCSTFKSDIKCKTHQFDSDFCKLTIFIEHYEASYERMAPALADFVMQLNDYLPDGSYQIEATEVSEHNLEQRRVKDHKQKNTST